MYFDLNLSKTEVQRTYLRPMSVEEKVKKEHV